MARGGTRRSKVDERLLASVNAKQGKTARQLASRGPSGVASGNRRVLADITNEVAQGGPRAHANAQAAERSRKLTELKQALRQAASPAAPAAEAEAALLASLQEDPAHVGEYVPGVLEHLRQTEAASLPWAGCMDHQGDINARMRAILVDWLVDLHQCDHRPPAEREWIPVFKSWETLFLAVNLADRYITRMPVPRKKLQLLGTAAMYLAAKFEEVGEKAAGWSVAGADWFAHMTDNTFTAQEILRMEISLLTVLGYKVSAPTAAHLFAILADANRCSEEGREVGRYLLELSLLSLPMVRHEPSRLASAALLLSNELLCRSPVWPTAMVQIARHSEQELQSCVRELRGLLGAVPSSSMQAVPRKYSLPRHLHVAQRVCLCAQGLLPDRC